VGKLSNIGDCDCVHSQAVGVTGHVQHKDLRFSRQRKMMDLSLVQDPSFVLQQRMRQMDHRYYCGLWVKIIVLW
jgi:hypothetical protein